MSLRRRIAGAAALAVAVAAIAVAVIGYVSTRSHLIGEVQHQLRGRAEQFLGPHRGGGGPGGPGGGGRGEPGEGRGFQIPGPPAPGGAQGYFQVIEPSGRVTFGGDLPLTKQVLKVARTGSGSFFSDARVNGAHYEIYTVWDADDHHVVQVALPLTDADTVLHGLLLPYGLLIGAGVMLALAFGLALSRSALRPIDQFLRETETVTSSLDHPVHLEESGPEEIRRLAASFNETLDALERSIEAQRNLVADASHELRTPIAALRSNIQIFLESDRLPENERVELQQSILAELDELTQIVADVLALARGSAPTDRDESIELDTIVREAVERTQRRAPDLRFRLALDPTVVTGDPDRVSRAVTNLVDNARKWSPSDGEVEIALHGGVLSVRDHGPGFREHDIPHVFDRFFRAERARRMPGSGLGLAIVKQAAEARGGGAVAANAEGGGAVVTVRFGPDGRPAR
jgi:two-component system, OmpR family, sensor histidine kinase MprB